MTERITPFPVRLPATLREWLQKQADESHRSLSGQILHILNAAYKAELEKEKPQHA